MKIQSLKDIENLPISQSDIEIGKRIEAILNFSIDNASLKVSHVAESIVWVIGYATYLITMPNNIEPFILEWIENTYDEDDFKYIDAISTIYANMTTKEAINSLKKKISATTNKKAKEILKEGLSEIQIKT